MNSRVILLTFLLFLPPIASRALDVSDDFSAAVVDTNRWGADQVFGNGSLVQTNGHIELRVSDRTQFDQGRRPWVLTQFPTTNAWEVQLDLLNTVTLTSGKQFTSLGVFIYNSADPNDLVAAEQFNSRLSGLPTGRGFYALLDRNRANLSAVSTADLGITNGAIRVAFEPDTQVLTVSYDRNPADGYVWYELASYGLAGSGGKTARTHWNMTSTDRFNLLIYGQGQNTEVGPGLITGDNLQITGALPFVIVPTPLTAAFVNVGEKCKQQAGLTCQVKAQLIVTNPTAGTTADVALTVFLSDNPSYDQSADTPLATVFPRELKPGKTKKLKVKISTDQSVSGRYLLAVDSNGTVLATALVP